MAQENAIIDEELNLEANESESFDFDELEAKLQQQLEGEFADLTVLQAEAEKINNPDELGKVIQDVVWEQFINQVAITAGEDFVKENYGLRLDLRDEAHIQTAENFAEGRIATHNHISREQLEQNYDRYKNMPHKKFRDDYVNPGMNDTLKRAGQLNKEGIETVTDIYTGEQIPTATKLPDGKNNPDAAQREHVKPSAELYKNPSLQMANDDKELAAIINDPENLQGYTTAERNNRKSDKTAAEMDDADKTEYWEKADKRAEEFVKKKEKEGEERLKAEGRKTQREEAFRISGKALRAVVMMLLADLARQVIRKLIKWLKSAKKSVKSLLASLKEAVTDFVLNLKNQVMNVASTALTTIFGAIWGPIVSTVKKLFMMMKQEFLAIKSAVDYLRAAENKGKPLGILIMEVGKIMMVGFTAAGAIGLSEAIETGLKAIPVVGPIFAYEIPLLGPLASLLGMFLGAVIAGIIGALVINLIQKQISEIQSSENRAAKIDKSSEILRTQRELQIIKEEKLSHTKATAEQSISERHIAAAEVISESFKTIAENCTDDAVDEKLSGIDDLLSELEDDE